MELKKVHVALILFLGLIISGSILILNPSAETFAIGMVFYGIAICVLILFWLRVLRGDITPTEEGMLRIVAIDDEADILRLIRIKLSKEGYEVSTASDGVEGVKKVLAEKPDVMIVDVMMPGKDGYQVVSEIKRKLGERAPVAILLTSKAEETDMVKGLSVGADDYVTKPFSPSELIERINVAVIKRKKNSK